jgi:preprotein translocase subunit SecF
MIPNMYQGNYKRLLLLPAILVVISFFYIPQIQLGVDFRGGTLITLISKQAVDGPMLKAQLQQDNLDTRVHVFQTTVGYKTEIEIEQSKELLKADELKNSFYSKISTLEQLELNASNDTAALPAYLEKRKEVNGVVDQLYFLAGESNGAGGVGNLNQLRKDVDVSYGRVYTRYRNQIGKLIDNYTTYESISVQSVSPILQKRFIEKALGVVIQATILITALVFIFLRKIIPACTIVIGAVWDIIIALGAMGLFGIPLSLPSFAALLMIVGFSLDTHILLTKKMLDPQGGEPRKRVWGALKTGTTMSVTGMASFIVLFGIASLMRISTYYDISSVALAGFMGDLFATWTINAVLLIWCVEKNE